MKRNHYYWLAASCALSLAGCGGGGNGMPDTMPVAPQGQWTEYTNKQFSGSDSLQQVNALTARNHVIAVGGIGSDLKPLVLMCSSAGACSQKSVGVSGANAIVTMVFDTSSNLYAGFTAPNAQGKLTATLMKLAPNAEAWVQVGTNTGPGSGLDVPLADKVLVTSTATQTRATGTIIDYYGTAALYDAKNNLVGSTTNTASGGLTHAVGDGLGALYVSGPGAYDSRSAPAGHYVWTWNSANNAFTKINTNGVTFSAIKGLASNQNGRIYVAGTGKATAAAVWKYDGATLSDMGFPGQSVNKVRYLPYKSTGDGYVIVAGLDNKFNSQVWAYNTQTAAWTELGLPVSGGTIGAIAADPVTGSIYVGIKNKQGAHRIWTFAG